MNYKTHSLYSRTTILAILIEFNSQYFNYYYISYGVGFCDIII